MSSHRLVSGTRRGRVSGVLVRNSQPWGQAAAHAAALQRCVVSRSVGQQLERVRHHVERGEDAAPLGRRLSVDHRGVRRAGEAPIDLVFVAEPPGELFGRRPQRQQVREDASRRFGEERVLVVPIREERRGERERFRLVPPLIARRPVRTPRVERIQDDIAALGRVELRRVFERRVVDDGGLAARLELRQQLADQRGLPGARVAHDEDVARLDARAGRARRACGGTGAGVCTKPIPSARRRRLNRAADTSSGPLSRRPCRRSRALADIGGHRDQQADREHARGRSTTPVEAASVSV